MLSRFLVAQGCIKPLCDLLICPDPRIVTVCLEGLENILKVGEAEKNLGAGDVNNKAQMIDDAEGLEKFENLQSHDNTEIYKPGYALMKMMCGMLRATSMFRVSRTEIVHQVHICFCSSLFA